MKVAVTAIGGRSGRVLSSDGALRFTLAPMPSAANGVTSPEQLFAAGHAASFLDAIREAAEQRGEILGPHCNVTASVSSTDDAVLAVALSVDLPCIARPLAQVLTTAALAVCPFSSTLREPVTVTVAVA